MEISSQEVLDETFYFDFSRSGRNYIRQPIIKKLQEVLKKGKMPDRGDEEYDMFAKYVNCFEHACFNLSNRELEELGIDCFEYTYRSPFGEFSQNSIHEAKEEMLEFLTQTGLLVEKFDGKKILKSNQHKVALYFSEAFEREQGERDYHFLLQRKDGKWSGKCGDMSSRVES